MWTCFCHCARIIKLKKQKSKIFNTEIYNIHKLLSPLHVMSQLTINIPLSYPLKLNAATSTCCHQPNFKKTSFKTSKKHLIACYWSTTLSLNLILDPVFANIRINHISHLSWWCYDHHLFRCQISKFHSCIRSKFDIWLNDGHNIVIKDAIHDWC